MKLSISCDIEKSWGHKIVACYKNSLLSVDSVLNSEYEQYWDLTDETWASFWGIQFQPCSQGFLSPALSRFVGRVGENPGNQMDSVYIH